MDSDPYIKDVAHVVRVVLRINFLPIFVNFLNICPIFTKKSNSRDDFGRLVHFVLTGFGDFDKGHHHVLTIIVYQIGQTPPPLA